METPIITFDDNSEDKIISALGFKSDEKGRLIDEKGFIVTDQDLEPLNRNEFGGILKGSKIVIKKNEAALIKYFVEQLEVKSQ